jgi:hypothetical protein
MELGPALTGNILVLYGHGAVTEDTFDFKRAHDHRMNIYSWTRKGIAVWDTQIELAANDALAHGKIRDSYATVNSSRIGGTIMNDYLIGPPYGLRLPHIPRTFSRTPIPELGATAHHDELSLELSKRIVLMIDDESQNVGMSAILYAPEFIDRPFDVLWCACKSEY